MSSLFGIGWVVVIGAGVWIVKLSTPAIWWQWLQEFRGRNDWTEQDLDFVSDATRFQLAENVVAIRQRQQRS